MLNVISLVCTGETSVPELEKVNFFRVMFPEPLRDIPGAGR